MHAYIITLTYWLKQPTQTIVVEAASSLSAEIAAASRYPRLYRTASTVTMEVL